MFIKKLYLDTSFISHLSAHDSPDKMRDTQTIWKYIQSGKFEVVISKITLDEIENCSEPKRSKMLEQLDDLSYQFSLETEKSITLAESYLKYGVLTEKSKVDLHHVALAVILNCDYILSWNFRHLVNVNTVNKIQAINKLLGYKDINIIPPSMLIEDEDVAFDPNVDYFHQIRYETYEKTKHMTHQELIDYTNIGAQKAIDEIERIRKSKE